MTNDDAFARARANYPGARNQVYLSVASKGLMSQGTRDAVTALMDEQMLGIAKKEAWQEMGEDCRARFARLIGATPAEIAFTKNVSEGLNAIAWAYPWTEGDNVIVCPTIEHPNNIYAWRGLDRRGVTLKCIDTIGDALDIEAMVDAIDARTRILTVASVSFTPGFRADLEALGRICRERGVMLVVDGVQSCGILDIDVKALGIGALATSTSKGLLGLYGQGFLFCDAAWIDRMDPAYLARFSVDQGGAHESEMGTLDYKLMPDARRFEIGNYNWPGIVAAHHALGETLELGTPAIEAHATRLATRLAEGLSALGLPVQNPPQGTARSHIVTVGTLDSGGAYATGDAALDALGKALEAGGVALSIRRGMLRFATHLYNNDADIDRVLEIAGGTVGRVAAE